MFKCHGFSFPLKLKLLRLEAGKSQEELASDLGISRSCLANYETGKRLPDNEMIQKIADTFKIMADYLIDNPTYKHVRLNEESVTSGQKLKELIKNHGHSLDISEFSVEHKIGLIEFYDYMLSRQTQKTQNGN